MSCNFGLEFDEILELASVFVSKEMDKSVKIEAKICCTEGGFDDPIMANYLMLSIV